MLKILKYLVVVLILMSFCSCGKRMAVTVYEPIVLSGQDTTIMFYHLNDHTNQKCIHYTDTMITQWNHVVYVSSFFFVSERKVGLISSDNLVQIWEIDQKDLKTIPTN